MNTAQLVIELCQSLVKHQSYSGEEEAVAKEIQDFAAKYFDEVHVDEVGNVLLKIKGKNEGPTVLFDGHIDTVPVNSKHWTKKPFYPEIVGDKMYGRGTSDMKGAVSAMIIAAIDFAKQTNKQFKGNIIVSCSVHEECFEGVASRSITRVEKPDYVVIGEATNLQPAIGQRGRAEIILETIGKPAHSSNPSAGVNAVYHMMKLVDLVKKVPLPNHPVLGDALLELTDIKSAPYPGKSVVPSNCTATFDRRTLVGETKESILASIQQVIAEISSEDPTFQAKAYYSKGSEQCYTGATITAERFFPAWVYDAEADFVKASLEALQQVQPTTVLTHYSFCTNGSHFAGEAGIPTIGYGPSFEYLAHIDDEYIQLSQLTQAVTGYAALMAALTALPTQSKGREEHV